MYRLPHGKNAHVEAVRNEPSRRGPEDGHVKPIYLLQDNARELLDEDYLGVCPFSVRSLGGELRLRIADG